MRHLTSITTSSSGQCLILNEKESKTDVIYRGPWKWESMLTVEGVSEDTLFCSTSFQKKKPRFFRKCLTVEVKLD